MLAQQDSLLPGVRNLLSEFPYKALDNGACEQFDEATKKCKVYDTRPDVCRVNRVYERVHSTYLSREVYYQLSEGVCKKMQEDEIKKMQPQDKPLQTV